MGGEHGGRPSGPGVRVVHLRTGIVLAPKGGALGKLLPLFKLGARRALRVRARSG